MIVALHTERDSWYGELPVTVRWCHPASKEWGALTIHIPRTSSALDLGTDGVPKYLEQDGGFWVEVFSYDLGTWHGIADVPTINRDGVDIECMERSTLFSIRRVSNAGYFECVPSGVIVKQAFQQAMGGLGHGIVAGTFAQGGPVIIGYEFSGQYFADVLADMMAWTGMEWWVDENGEFHWGGINGLFYPFHLCDDGDVLGGERSGSIREMAVEVTAANDVGMELSSFGMDDKQGAFWPRQVVVGSNGE